MAALALPAIVALAPDLINLISSLVHKHAPVAEANGGPGTGISKFTDVPIAVMKELTLAKTQGTIADLPAPEIVKVIIQAVVNSMKLSGTLGATPDPVAAGPSSQVITIASGQAITIRVA